MQHPHQNVADIDILDSIQLTYRACGPHFTQHDGADPDAEQSAQADERDRLGLTVEELHPHELW